MSKILEVVYLHRQTFCNAILQVVLMFGCIISTLENSKVITQTYFGVFIIHIVLPTVLH